MVLTDLDGTFLRSDGSISPENLETLNRLKKSGITTVAATGRSLHSSEKVLNSNLPFDFLIFSTGAGILKFDTGEIIYQKSLIADDIHSVSDFFYKRSMDFSIHHPIPDNHIFHAYHSKSPTLDFIERLGFYKSFIRYGDFRQIKCATQLLAVTKDDIKAIDDLKQCFKHLSIIRATSPIDGKHIWIEVFPPDTSKGTAAEWLCKRLEIDNKDTMSIGNDYNDLALLEWTTTSYVVSNSPVDMLEQFSGMPSNDENGFAVAVDKWISEKFNNSKDTKSELHNITVK